MLTERARRADGTEAFTTELDDALGAHERSTSFLPLLLVHVDGEAAEIDLRETTLRRVAEAQPPGAVLGSLDDGSLAVLGTSVDSPADAIDRCDQVLATVRAASLISVDDIPTVSVGLALAPGWRAGSSALLADAGRAVRRAASDGGDRWASS